MAYSVLQSVVGVVAGSGNCTAGGGSAPSLWTSNLSSGSKLIAWVSIDHNVNTVPTSVKDAALNSFAMVGSVAYSGTSGGFSCWVLDTPAGDVGIKPVITSTNPTNFGAIILVQEVSGLLAGSTAAVIFDGGAAATNTGTTSPATGGSYSSTAANEYLAAAVGDAGNNAQYTLTGYTQAQQSASNTSAQVAVGYKNSANGAETMSWAIGTVFQWGTLLVAFQLAGGTTTATAGLATATGSADPLNTSGPSYSGAASDLGGGTGSWANPGNADGTPDGSYAVWSIP